MKFNFESWQEFLDWNVKRENHIKELEDRITDLEDENYELRKEGWKKDALIAELTEKNATAENSDE